MRFAAKAAKPCQVLCVGTVPPGTNVSEDLGIWEGHGIMETRWFKSHSWNHGTFKPLFVEKKQLELPLSSTSTGLLNYF